MLRKEGDVVLKALMNGLSQWVKKRKPLPGKRQLGNRYVAVLGDIHSNVPALREVLAYLDQAGIDEILVVGDVVGYGPFPGECIDLLIQRQALVISGNHDYVTATGEYPRGFSPDARWVIEWGREHLSDEHVAWLGQLSKVYHQDDWMAVHGAPVDRHYFYAYVYAMTYQENLQHMADTGVRFCFHGHSHIPGVFFRNKQGDGFNDATHLSLRGYDQALICPGSIGQPRSGKQGAEFGVFDREELQWRSHRLNYDVEHVMDVMRDNGFPSQLITRLGQGR